MSKEATASFKYAGDVEALQAACVDACRQTSLKIKSESAEATNGFSIEASEKMKWLTTNWPVSFRIRVQRSGDKWAVIVTAGTKLFSATQDFNNQHKAKELADLIQTLAPTPN